MGRIITPFRPKIMPMHSQSIPVTINGEIRRVSDNLTVESLLAELQIHSDRVAIELDKAIVRKRDWAHTLISTGSQLEIVEFVGGG